MTAAAVRVIQWNGTTRSSCRPPVMASADRPQAQHRADSDANGVVVAGGEVGGGREAGREHGEVHQAPVVRPRRTSEDLGTAACTVQPKVSLSTPATGRPPGTGPAGQHVGIPAESYSPSHRRGYRPLGRRAIDMAKITARQRFPGAAALAQHSSPGGP
jgi:hypothetical protein